MAKDSTTDDYYPFRWKVADTVEDIFVLHRTKAIAVLALLGLGFIILGFVIVGGGADNSTTNTASPSTSSPPSTAPTDDVDDSSTSSEVVRSSTTMSTTTTSTTSTTAAPTSTTTSTTTTNVPVSSRGVPTAEQLANTSAGAVAELSPTTIRVVGGQATDEEADDVIERVSSIYSDLAIEDLQVVDPSFAATSSITFRLSAPDLFDYNRADLNPTYLPLIDQLAAATVEAGSWRIEVSGHTDDIGPAEGNQQLSERRALSAAQRLISEGVSSGQVTSVGRGEDEPIESNGTEAGRLANRRVEFVLIP